MMCAEDATANETAWGWESRACHRGQDHTHNTTTEDFISVDLAVRDGRVGASLRMRPRSGQQCTGTRRRVCGGGSKGESGGESRGGAANNFWLDGVW